MVAEVPPVPVAVMVAVLVSVEDAIITMPLGALLHVTFWSVALSGVMVAVRVSLLFTSRVKVLGDSVTSVTL